MLACSFSTAFAAQALVRRINGVGSAAACANECDADVRCIGEFARLVEAVRDKGKLRVGRD